MRKVLDKKTLEREAAFWRNLKKASEQAPIKLCHK
jgi:hypothetical protein